MSAGLHKSSFRKASGQQVPEKAMLAASEISAHASSDRFRTISRPLLALTLFSSVSYSDKQWYFTRATDKNKNHAQVSNN